MAKTSVTLDIATRFVGQTEDMYIVRPGEGFSLYNDFLRHRAIFLDFPDIRLDFAATPKKDALRQAVVRSMELREWHRRHQRGALEGAGTLLSDQERALADDYIEALVAADAGSKEATGPLDSRGFAQAAVQIATLRPQLIEALRAD